MLCCIKAWLFICCSWQVCKDIDECQDPPENGSCTANSHCYNTMVRPLHVFIMTIAVYFSTCLTVNCSNQGSFYCGECKTGFTGDQVKGCHGTKLCPNGKISPCHISANCVIERDGSIGCLVKNWKDSAVYISNAYMMNVNAVMCLGLCRSVWRWLDGKWLFLWEGHRYRWISRRTSPLQRQQL